MEKLLVIFNCYFNYKDIEKTIISILDNNVPVDIIFLENPSKYSNKIREIAIKYKIFKHYICSDNIECNTWTLFINTHMDIIKQYNYIAMTEGDTVLSNGSINECLTILKKYNNCGNCSIDIDLNYEKYGKLPIREWVPVPIDHEDCYEGIFGWQFMIFKQHFLLDFISAINNKEIAGYIALGSDVFYGLSDTNLFTYVNRRGTRWLRTKKHNLDHIGWEHYLDDNDEYYVEKRKSINDKKIRVNFNLDNYKLIELHE